MGLFGKLFDKKECAICGGEIGLLGNRKLEDGNMCKECAKKLSYWFSERKQSTVAEIKKQLADREANKAKVAAFHTTRSIGRHTLVCLDEDKQQFMVCRTKKLEEENPDVLELSQVTGCDLDVQEHRTEQEYRDKDGKMVKYQPPRYNYSYDFYVVIRVNSPWFKEMRFKLNNASVQVHNIGGPASGLGKGVSIVRAISGGPTGVHANRDYVEYEEMGNEIRQALMAGRRAGAGSTGSNMSAPISTATPVQQGPVTCPWCGATTTPDAAGYCEYCGGSVKG